MKNHFITNSGYLYSLIFISFFFFSFELFAQKTDPVVVKYSYDENGNRIRRWIDITKLAIPDTTDTLDQDSLIKKNINNSHALDGMITLFPNPTEGLLDMKITGMKDGETAEYAFVSLTGQELLRKKTGSPVSRIDISAFPPGTYLVNVTLRNQVQTWKIVKH
jgi:hypothetical protein